jgi:hypothetical protein
VAKCTNNKDVFVCILRFHARRAYLQHYQTLMQELKGDSETRGDQPESGSVALGADAYEQESTLFPDRNINVACKTSI